jgi:hypothetical protein
VNRLGPFLRVSTLTGNFPSFTVLIICILVDNLSIDFIFFSLPTLKNFLSATSTFVYF